MLQKIRWSNALLPSLLLLVFGVSARLVSAAEPAIPYPPEMVPFVRDLRYLSSDQLGGRGNNQPEIETAAQYIADSFKQSGLLPAGDGGTYFQTFAARTHVGLATTPTLSWRTANRETVLTFGSDYTILAYSSAAALEGEVVFAGYGITAPEFGYDDYGRVDVSGKIVAVFQHEPHEDVPGNLFQGQDTSFYSTLPYKVANAYRRGATGLLLLNDPFCQKDRAWNDELRMGSMPIPVLKLSSESSGRLLRSGGDGFRSAVNRAARSLTLAPLKLPLQITAYLPVEETHRLLRNVLALLPGSSDETIVVGAHYDHLGLGEIYSLSPSQAGEIHNGADDNASGTAGLLHLARRLFSEKRDRTILFIAFSGEELGLLGSRYYVKHPKIPLRSTLAMINLDMIGRSEGEVMIGGIGTAVEFKGLLNNFEPRSGLVFRCAETPQAASDHLAFADEKVPVLFFSTGLHADYHRPSDDWEKIRVGQTGQILSVVRRLIRRMSMESTEVSFVETDTETASLGGTVGPDLAMIGLGTDFGWESEGVRVANVTPGKTAARVGLQPGDVIVGWNDRALSTRFDLIDALRREISAAPGVFDVIRAGALLRLPLVR